MSKVSFVPIEFEQPTVSPASAKILAFPSSARRNTLRAIDRIEILQWATVAQEVGLSRVEICDDEADPEIGHFVLVYEDGREWASWGVSRDSFAFSIWRVGTPGDFGTFATMRDALGAILSQPRRQRRKLPIG